MATGLGLLGIPSRDFWSMTPRELAAAVRGRLDVAPSAKPIQLSDLHDLMRRFPDDNR